MKKQYVVRYKSSPAADWDTIVPPPESMKNELKITAYSKGDALRQAVLWLGSGFLYGYEKNVLMLCAMDGSLVEVCYGFKVEAVEGNEDD